jgi:hypothetical protein
LRRFCDDETRIDRGATSIYGVAAIDAHVIYGGAARRSYGPRAIGTSFGPLRTSVARSRSFRGPTLRPKLADLQVFPAMARPGLEPGTPRFSAVVRSRRPGWATSERPLPFAQSSTLPGSCWARGPERRNHAGAGASDQLRGLRFAIGAGASLRRLETLAARPGRASPAPVHGRPRPGERSGAAASSAAPNRAIHSSRPRRAGQHTIRAPRPRRRPRAHPVKRPGRFPRRVPDSPVLRSPLEPKDPAAGHSPLPQPNRTGVARGARQALTSDELEASVGARS